MIAGLRVLGLIPARGGSKGLLRKNILRIAGRPLISWTIETAKSSQVLDRTIVSTDDNEIAEVARACGGEVPFRRPADLAKDNSTTMDVVFHALDSLDPFDIVVVLQPTSPLRIAADIDGAVKNMVVSSAPACVSVVESECSPYWMYHVDESACLNPVIAGGAEMYPQRQQLPRVFELNGAIYAANCEWLKISRQFVTSKTIAYQMPAIRSIDIDTEDDVEEFRLTVDKGGYGL